MITQFKTPQPDLSRLKSTLLTSGLQTRDNPTFQTIEGLINATQRIQDLINADIATNTGSITAIQNADFLTWVDDSVLLPNSRNLIAGQNIVFNDVTPNERTISVTQFTTGSIIFAGASGELTQNNSNLFWDDSLFQLQLSGYPIRGDGTNRNIFGGSGAGDNLVSGTDIVIWGQDSLGGGVTTASSVFLFGPNSGNGASSLTNVTGAGEAALQNANASNSNAFGHASGSGGTYDSTNMFGSLSGFGSTLNSVNSLGQNNSRSATLTFVDSIGDSAGRDSISFGSVYSGRNAGRNVGGGDDQLGADYVIATGYNALRDAVRAANTIGIGKEVGNGDSVDNLTGDKFSILLGNYTNTGGFSNSVAISQGVMNSTEQQFNIGNVLYGLNIYTGTTPSSTPIVGGLVGIGKDIPTNILDIYWDQNGTTAARITNPNSGTNTGTEFQTSGEICNNNFGCSGSGNLGYGGIPAGNVNYWYTAGGSLTIMNDSGFAIIIANSGIGGPALETARFDAITGNFGWGIISPSAYIHIKAGTTVAGTAPLKFNSGSLLTTAEVGAVEYLTDKAYLTITTGTARKELTLNNSALTSGTVPVATTNGRLTDGGATTTELSYLSGVTSAIQTQLNAKQASGNYTTIVDTKALTNQATDIGSANFTGTSSGSQFRVNYVLEDTTADITAGAVVLTIAWTDDAGATTLPSSAQVLTGLGRTSGTIYIQRASGSISYATSHTGLFGSSKYALYMTCEKLS